MNSFSYTNPYTQPRRDASLSQPETPDTLLHQLEMANAKTLEQSLPQLISRISSMDWKMTHVLRLVDWFFTSRVRNPKKEDIMALALMLVNKCLQTWEVRLVYSAAVHQDENNNRMTFLSLIEDLSLCNVLYLRVAALSTLTTIWEALDRLQIIISCLNPSDDNSGWWIPSIDNEQWGETIKFVVQSISQNELPEVLSNTTSEKPMANVIRVEEWRATCASFLSQLLQHQEVEWTYLYNEQFFETFLRSLAKEASRLNDSNTPATHCKKLSLTCFQLCIALSEIQSSYERPEDMSQYTCIYDLVNPVVLAAFSKPESPTSRPLLPVSQCAQDSLVTLFRSSLKPLKDMATTHPLIRQQLEDGWSRLLKEPGNDVLQMDMQSFCLMYFMMESTSCKYLTEIIGRNDAARAYRNITANLWHEIQSDDSVWAAGLYSRILLRSGNQLYGNGLSRVANDSVDARSIIQWVDLAVSNQSLSMSVDYHIAITICLLDMALNSTKKNERLREEVFKTMSTETLERLICAMSPKVKRMDVVSGGNANQTFESEESTPPANNLSRTDETCILIEEDMKSRGFDVFVRISTASFLATLAKPFNEGHSVDVSFNQQQKIIKSVHDYMSDQNVGLTSPLCDKCSQETVVRRLQLFLIVARCGNENSLLCSLLSAETAQRRMVAHGRRKIEEHQKELHLSRQRERTLQAKCDALKRQVSQQQIVFQRQKLDIVQSTELQAKQLIEIHRRERNRAEQQVEELSARVQEAERLRGEYSQLLEKSRESENAINTELEHTARQCSELKAQQFALTATLESKETEVKRLTNELESSKHTWQETSTNEKRLREHIDGLEQDLESAEEMNHELRDSLENIFSDMSKLAHLYQEKEKELKNSKENESNKTESIERRLRSQEMRNKEMQEELRQLKYDNEVLSKKYETAKARIQKERKDRQKDLERTERRMKTSNISYINQLHQPSSSRSRHDKENESYRSHHTSRSSESRR